MAGTRYALQGGDLLQNLQFGACHLISLQQRFIRYEIFPGIAGLFFGLPAALFNEMACLRMRKEKQFLSVQIEDVGDSSNQPKRRPALTALDIRDVAGLDAQPCCELTLRQFVRIARLAYHLSKSSFAHVSYPANEANFDFA